MTQLANVRGNYTADSPQEERSLTSRNTRLEHFVLAQRFLAKWNIMAAEDEGCKQQVLYWERGMLMFLKWQHSSLLRPNWILKHVNPMTTSLSANKGRRSREVNHKNL